LTPPSTPIGPAAALPPAAPRRSAAATAPPPWPRRLARLSDRVAGYLPLLLMALIALGTWWLVRQTPLREPPAAAVALPGVPDYTMERFALQRFGADGRLRLQLEGRELRHYAQDDRIVVDDARLQARADDGARVQARARRASADAEGHQVDLHGDVAVVLAPPPGRAAEADAELRGEFLQVLVQAQRLRSDRPVTLVHGRNRVDAAGVEVDQRTRQVVLAGPLRASLLPAAPR
jgi:lipopolysaccharide export system protein LptC